MLYAIADIHGRLDLLTDIYGKVREDIERKADPAGAQIIFLGDYIDRGPNSKGCLDFLMGLDDSDEVKHICLLGNHEDFMLSLEAGDLRMIDCWLDNGGVQTLKSFGINYSFWEIDKSQFKPYFDWLRRLPTYYQTDSYIFCHSGRFDPSRDLDAQRESLIWGRPSQNQYPNLDKWVVHGHTPTCYEHNHVPFEPYIERNRINVDTGAWFSTGHTQAAVVLPLGNSFDGKCYVIR